MTKRSPMHTGTIRIPLPIRTCCGKPVTVTKILGGGESWFYAYCGCGALLGAAHEDDKEKMQKLYAIRDRANFFRS